MPKKSDVLSLQDARSFSRLSQEDKRAFISLLTDAEALQLKYMWEAWARDNQFPASDKYVTWLNMGGRGCIAKGTRIYDPIADTHTPVEDLARAGTPITVLAFTEQGAQPAKATAPFIKGIAPLYRVTLEDGRQIVTTMQHRFLTQQGWKSLSSLAKDDLLGCAPDLEASTAVSSLSMSPVSERYYSQTVGDYQDHCLLYSRLRGVLPREAEGSVLTSLPSQDDAGIYIHSYDYRDDQDASREDNRQYPVLDFPLSKSSCDLDVPLLLNEEGQVLSFVHARTLPKPPIRMQSHAWNDVAMPVLSTCSRQSQSDDTCVLPSIHEDGVFDSCPTLLDGAEWFEAKHQLAHQLTQWTFPTRTSQPPAPVEPLFSHICDASSYADYICWQRVLSIDFEEVAVFYDLTVPGPANYLANGIWNHNSGKTRAGAEWTRKKAKTSERIHLIARTAADIRDVMVGGESGILAISPPWDKPDYQPSRRRLVWPNGAQAITFSAEEPDSLRGPQCSSMWCDEVGAWQYAEEAWDQAMFGLRLGENTQACATTTPRVTKLIKKLLQSPTTVISRSSTYDNRANLAATFFSEVITRYENTRLGRQELMGELIEDVEGALWTRDLLDTTRVLKAPSLIRVVVGVDPAVTSGENSDETGIIVAGEGIDHHAYVLADYTLRGTPLEWARAVVTAYHLFQADRVVGEANNGGDLIEQNIRTVEPNISYKSVHASRGKVVRAEPIVSLYEQNRAHHVGNLPYLEDEQCTWEQGKKSPNRIDAAVWALTELAINGGDIPMIISSGRGTPQSAQETRYISSDEDENARLQERQERLSAMLNTLRGGLR